MNPGEEREISLVLYKVMKFVLTIDFNCYNKDRTTWIMS